MVKLRTSARIKANKRPQRAAREKKPIETLTQSTEKPKLPTPKIPIIEGKEVPMESMLRSRVQNDIAKWPKTAKFQTIANNVAGDAISESGKEAIEMGLLKENKICCNCKPGQDCTKNPSCRCRMVSNHLGAHFGNKSLLLGVPIEFRNDMYWEAPMFACSPLCGCKGKCKQNALQDMDQDQDLKFVIRRIDEKGFCLFTNRYIGKGMPVISFNGEMNGYKFVNKAVLIEQYALLLSQNDDKLRNFLLDSSYLEKNYRNVLRNAFATKIWINPLKKGNCARFLSHGCESNLELTRVFQGGLSPANLRIVLFAKRAIIPGEELTFDYGKDYKDAHLGVVCLCIACLVKRKGPGRTLTKRKLSIESASSSKETPSKTMRMSSSSNQKPEKPQTKRCNQTKNNKNQQSQSCIRSGRTQNSRMKSNSSQQLREKVRGNRSLKNTRHQIRFKTRSVEREVHNPATRSRFHRAQSQDERVVRSSSRVRKEHDQKIRTRHQSRREVQSQEREISIPVIETPIRSKSVDRRRRSQTCERVHHICDTRTTRSQKRLDAKSMERARSEVLNHVCDTRKTRSQARQGRDSMERELTPAPLSQQISNVEVLRRTRSQVQLLETESMEKLLKTASEDNSSRLRNRTSHEESRDRLRMRSVPRKARVEAGRTQRTGTSRPAKDAQKPRPKAQSVVRSSRRLSRIPSSSLMDESRGQSTSRTIGVKQEIEDEELPQLERAESVLRDDTLGRSQRAQRRRSLSADMPMAVLEMQEPQTNGTGNQLADPINDEMVALQQEQAPIQQVPVRITAQVFEIRRPHTTNNQSSSSVSLSGCNWSDTAHARFPNWFNGFVHTTSSSITTQQSATLYQHERKSVRPIVIPSRYYDL